MTTQQPIASDIIIYQAPNGAIELNIDNEQETVRANQAQMAELFWVTSQNITLHLKNIYKEQELIEGATCKESLQVQLEGSRTVKRNIKLYNLDVLISVWYRINSLTGTKFRQRATTTLRQHITQGFTINPNRIQLNYQKFLQAVDDVKALASHSDIPTDDILELIKIFGQTWFSLDAFDKQSFIPTETTPQTVYIQSQELYADILTLKSELMSRGEASELFAQEKNHNNLEGIFGNVFQSAYGDDAYPSIESKAAHLLYFIIKNHPFTDGNKRSGAFAFVWLLQKTGYTFRHKITPEALTAITLLIATSQTSEKERLINLVILLLQDKQ